MRKLLESSLQNAITKVIVIEHQLTCHTFNKSVCQSQRGFKRLRNNTMKLCKDVGIHP
jgi:hypothetical protein